MVPVMATAMAEIAWTGLIDGDVCRCQWCEPPMAMPHTLPILSLLEFQLCEHLLRNNRTSKRPIHAGIRLSAAPVSVLCCS